MTELRRFSLLDQCCLRIDHALRAMSAYSKTTERLSPAEAESEPFLTSAQRRVSAGLMRVNHAGEVCAQALYHGQGLISRSQAMRENMQQAALEEGDHLAWCRTRLVELGSHTSYLNPVWYTGSFVIGLLAGAVSDKWSLGFLAETEQQVVQHLASHLQKLPVEDTKSQKILQQMQIDEAEHRDSAMAAGAMTLPQPIKMLMSVVSKIMVKTAYWI